MPTHSRHADIAQWKPHCVLRKRKLPLMVWLMAIFLAADAGAQSPAREEGKRALQPIGDLECVASRLTTGRIGTKLSCKLVLTGQQTAVDFEGEMYGEALYLALPMKGRVHWKVLAPNPGLKAADVVGDYDRVSKHGFQYPRDNRKVLLGGMDDVVGLELTAPVIDGLDASTLLTLRQQP